MPWINRFILIFCFWFISCELHEPIFDNSLDLEVAAEKGIYPPALVFFPNNAEVTVGDTVEVEVYANNEMELSATIYHEISEIDEMWVGGNNE